MDPVSPLGIPVRREHLTRPPVALWAALTLFIVYGTLLPFRFVTDRAFIRDKLARVTFNPLVSPDTGRRVSIPDVAQNVALFLPFGFLGVLSLRSRERAGGAPVAAVTALAAALAAGVEALQLFTPDRTASFADLTACTAGAFAGALACEPVTAWWRVSRTVARGAALTTVPAFRLFAAAGVLVCAASWAPFDVTLDVGNLAAKLHTFRADPWQTESLGGGLLTAIRFAAFGTTLGLWLRDAGVRRAAPVAMIAGGMSAVAIESLQWLFVSRMPGLEDALLESAAAAAGAVISVGWPFRIAGIFWWGIWLVVTSAGTLLVLNAQTAGDPMAPVTAAWEVALWIAPVVYGWRLVRREPGSYARR